MKRLWMPAVFGSLATVLAAPQPQPQPVIRVGTRLVQVDVVVRDKNGPVVGLTRDDFTILDQGKRHQIAVFSGMSVAPKAPLAASAAPPPSGTISNRTDSRGVALAGTTVLLIDLLNTPIEDQGYMRKGASALLESLQENERVAIYVLANKLTVLQDFTDDPQKLLDTIRKIGPNLALIMQSDENEDSVDRNADSMSGPFYAQIRARITAEATSSIAAHLSGIQGRKNVIWLSDQPRTISGHNIAVYPVLPHGIGSSGVFAWMRDSREGLGAGRTSPFLGAGQALEHERGAAQMAALSGGVAFNDAKDLPAALHRAEQDAAGSYTLGYYPEQASLDGTMHTLKVEIAGRPAGGKNPTELNYRQRYLATAQEPAPRPPVLHALLVSALDATGIGVTARMADNQVLIHVDLHDVHFERVNDRYVASLALSVSAAPYDSYRTQPVKLEMTGQQLAAALEGGADLRQPAPVESGAPGFGIVVQDTVTGAAGSVHLPLAGK